MIYSMTAYSTIQKQVLSSTLSWELKSVNNRYLDISFRLPDPLRFLEPNLRRLCRGQLARGKVECQLRIASIEEAFSMVLDEGKVEALLKAGTVLEQNYQLMNDLSVSHLLTYPDILTLSAPDWDALAKPVEEAFQEALLQLLSARLAEGSALQATLDTRLQCLEQEIQKAEQCAANLAIQQREKLQTRLAALNLAVSDTRIEQELALILTRLDMTEELDRLKSHVEEVKRILKNEAVVGRQLDFFMQELNREANTLSSKSDSVVLTQHAVQMKVLIEQMREQIQNIE